MLQVRCALGLTLLFGLGCATYQKETGEFKSFLQSNEPTKAAENLKKKAEEDGKDQVVFLMDYATALQAAQDYKASNLAFQKVDSLTEVKDYHSISKVTASMLGSATMVQYKGEDYEKVLINAMMAINFLMVGDYDNANAMTRRLNDKLYKYRYEGKKPYEQNTFAYYLSSMLWESNKEYDNAYINLKKAYDLEPSVGYFKADLLRMAREARREDDLAKWKKSFPNVKEANLKENGELVLIFQQGWAPVKRPHPNFPRIPKLYPVPATTQYAQLEIEKGPTEKSQQIYSVNDVAIKNLDDQYASIIAGRAAGIVAKEVVADQIRQKNELLGVIAWAGMHLSDQADLRQWVSLPASFQVAKIALRPGKYRVRAVGLSSSQTLSGEASDWMEVKVAARKKTFINWRAFK